MELKEQYVQDRVRENTSEEINSEIDQRVINNLTHYYNRSSEEITKRLDKLQKEWDIEKTLEVNASAIGLTALMLGRLANRRWYILTGIVSGFLLQQGLQGWCPPLQLFRALGIRTRREIDEEIYALRVLRGDFDEISANSGPDEIIRSFRG